MNVDWTPEQTAEFNRRRRSRNLALGIVLGLLVVPVLRGQPREDAAVNAATANRTTALWALGFAAAMAGLAYASVPLYRAFCAATGFAGTTSRAAAAPTAPVAGETIKVRFDGNTSPGMPWLFKPVTVETTVPIGGRRMAFFRATNISGATTTGRAAFNVSPDLAGKYFKKIACFCFTEQTLKAGETVDMPVTYFIDPAILDDPQARKIDEITLSYTFFPVDAGKADPVSPAARTQG